MCWADFEEFLTNKLRVWKNADWWLQGGKFPFTCIAYIPFTPLQTQTGKERKNHFWDVGVVKILFQVRVPLQCEQLPPRHERDKYKISSLHVSCRITTGWVDFVNFSWNSTSIENASCHQPIISRLFIFFWLAFLTWPIRSRVQLQAKSQGADFTSTLLQLTGAFLSLQLAKLTQNNHSLAGENFSWMPGNQMWLHFVAEFKLYNGLSIYLSCVKGWKDRQKYP